MASVKSPQFSVNSSSDSEKSPKKLHTPVKRNVAARTCWAPLAKRQRSRETTDENEIGDSPVTKRLKFETPDISTEASWNKLAKCWAPSHPAESGNLSPVLDENFENTGHRVSKSGASVSAKGAGKTELFPAPEDLPGNRKLDLGSVQTGPDNVSEGPNIPTESVLAIQAILSGSSKIGVDTLSDASIKDKFDAAGPGVNAGPGTSGVTKDMVNLLSTVDEDPPHTRDFSTLKGGSAIILDLVPKTGSLVPSSAEITPVKPSTNATGGNSIFSAVAAKRIADETEPRKKVQRRRYSCENGTSQESLQSRE